jgi:hypothetical protein
VQIKNIICCRIEIYKQLNAQFFIYSIIILYHDPLHVSSITCSSSGALWCTVGNPLNHMLQFMIAHNHVLVTVCIACMLLISTFFTVQQLLVVHGLLITEASRSHSDASRSVGLLCKSDQPDAETSTWQHTTLTRDRHPCPRWDSSPQFQQKRGHRLSLRPRCDWDRLVANYKRVNCTRISIIISHCLEVR